MASRFCWPMAVGDTVYADLPKALVDTARIHAQRALDDGTRGPLELLDQAISIGVAAELLLKAVLASVEFGLLAGKQGDIKTTLTLAGKPLDLTLTLPDMKSVGAADALEILAKMAAARKLHSSSSLHRTLMGKLLAVRDSAVHMGFASQEANDDAVPELIRLIDIVIKLNAEFGHDGDWESFWTAEYREQADEILRLRQVRIKTAFQQVVSAAQKTYATRWQSQAAAETIRIIEQVDSFPRIERDQTSRHHICPACGSKGWVLYDIERGPVQVDESDFPHSVAYFVELSGVPSIFHCALCDLLLDDEDDLHLAGVYEIDLGETEAEDAEVDRAFGGPEDDRWDDDH